MTSDTLYYSDDYYQNEGPVQPVQNYRTFEEGIHRVIDFWVAWGEAEPYMTDSEVVSFWHRIYGATWDDLEKDHKSRKAAMTCYWAAWAKFKKWL